MINSLSFISRAALLPAALIASLCVLSAAQWDSVCPGAVNGTYSDWNTTRCDSSVSTCCSMPFSLTGVGCCPWPNAVCCPNGYTCCPQGTQCVNVSGSGYRGVYNCTLPSGSVVGLDRSVCKPGPLLPMDPVRKNVIVIGDSVSLGYTPFLATALEDVALVQHSPASDDGGAEETGYAALCVPFWLVSPSGMPFVPDVIIFNSGMHNGPVWNVTLPGQNAPASEYAAGLLNVTAALVDFSAAHGTKLLYLLTTPMLCNVTGDGCTQNLNNQAAAIMKQFNIPILDMRTPIINKCGPVPQASCFNETGCWCPHCPPGYSWLTNTTIAPAVRALLMQGDAVEEDVDVL